MTKVTFCPHHIFGISSDIEPEAIEIYYIAPLIEFIKSAKKESLQICISHSLMEEFEQNYPWNMLTEKAWEKWINDWYGSLKAAFKDLDIIVHENNTDNRDVRCNALSEEVNALFNSFLAEIGTHSLHDHSNEESVFAASPWCSAYDDFIKIECADNIKFAKHTWYKIYPDNLPCTGEIPFVPPERWRTSSQPRRENAPHSGYIDIESRAWRWDRLHRDHWDVQNPGGGRGNYKNVTPDGRILRDD